MIPKLNLLIVIVLLSFNSELHEKTQKNNIFSFISSKIDTHSGKKQPGEHEEQIRTLYNTLVTTTAKPSYEVYKKGVTGYFRLKSENLIKKDLLTLVDYSLPSVEERLWVIDMKENKVISHTLVAHGRNSGMTLPTAFSNKPQSYKSSLGLFLTGDTYFGKHGLSLFLKGIEKGINDNALTRSIVMHGAEYVSQAFIKAHGYLGRSLGCPSIPEDKKEEIIPAIAKGSCLFIYHPSLSNKK